MAVNIELQELCGSNNKIVGSIDYFQKFNTNGVLKHFLKKDCSISYYFNLNDKAKDFKDALETIYSDLSKYKSQIWLVDEKLRTDLKVFTAHLNDYALLFLNSESTKAARIYDILKSGKGPSGKSVKELRKLTKRREIVNSSNKKLKGDIELVKDFNYSNSSFIGKSGKGIFTEDYKKHIEKQIFGKNLAGKYIHNGYKIEVIGELNTIIEELNNDLSKNVDDYYIEPKNFDNISNAAEEFKLLGDDSYSKTLQLLAKYEYADITERLQQVMHNSENDVPDKFKTPMNKNIEHALPSASGLLGIITSDSAKFESERLIYFKNLVGDGCKYDLKEKGWVTPKYFYDGKVYANDCTGNIVYGYFGLAMGIPEDVLFRVPGIIQIKNGTSKLEYSSSYFDDPRDQEFIKIGMEYYKRTH